MDKVQNSVILKSKYYFFYIRMSKKITGFLTIPVTAWLYLTTDKVYFTAPQPWNNNQVRTTLISASIVMLLMRTLPQLLYVLPVVATAVVYNITNE